MSQIPRVNPLKSTLWVRTFKLEFGKIQIFFGGGYFYEEFLVQFRKWYLILRPRKCEKYECRRYPILPLCAPGTSNFEKCRNRFLGICMKIVLEQFRRRYLISRSRKSQKHECHGYPVLTPKNQPFVSLGIRIWKITEIGS